MTDYTVQCLRCKAPQSIPTASIVFVCSSCHSVNRVDGAADRTLSIVDCDDDSAVMIPNTPQLFSLGEGGGGPLAVPVCSVCLESPGDVILSDCGHGGLCEACARHILLNKAVGGSHCPKCRSVIKNLVRVSEIHEEFVKGKKLEIQESKAKTPPKVPPPVGLRKAKEGEEE